ncbi:MAG: ABC transporter permease, partial [Ilumatobacteraceae bacterium]
NAELVTDVAFAKIVAPLSGLIEGLVDLAIGVFVLLVAAIIADTGPDLLGVAIGLPAATALLILTSAGPVLLFSAAVVRYRDVGLIVGFGIELFLFISPVAYPPELVPEGLRTVQYINPLASCLELMRWGFAGSPAPTLFHILLSVASASALLLAGWEYFRAREREFVDII